MKYFVALAALFAMMVRAEEEGCGLGGGCGVGMAMPAPEMNAASSCVPCGDYPRDCLGACECPYGATRQFGVLDGQAQCQDVLEVACRGGFEAVESVAPRCLKCLDRIVPNYLKKNFQVRQVCVSQNIFVRPFCHLPALVSSALSHAPKLMAADVAPELIPGCKPSNPFEILECLAKFYNVQYVIVERPDGGYDFVVRVAKEDCLHACPEGFYFAEEIRFSDIYQVLGRA